MSASLDTSGEEWRAVVGYDGLYEVSNLGNVRSLPRIVRRGARRMRIQGVRLQPRTLPPGYKYVNLRRESREQGVAVHRLVAIAFIPNPDDKPNVNHFDNDPANNIATNLRWCTQAENIQHAAAQGRLDWDRVRKPKLDPFTEGYIAAMRASMSPDTQDDPLAPETLAAILKDCAEACTAGPGVVYDNSDKGREFWEERQRGDYSITLYPPLTPYLGDDGKVYLKEAA